MKLGVRHACLLLSFALLMWPQTRHSSPARNQLIRWLAAFNGTDWDAYLAFVKDHFATPPAPMYRNHGFREMTGGFTLQKVNSESGTEVVGVVQERDSDFLARIVVQIEMAEPHQIVKLQTEPIPPVRLPLRELLVRTREYVQKRVSADQFAGAILVAKAGKELWAHAYGWADREHRIPNSLQTRFRLGSMNKMFTAVAILQLSQSGRLQLDDFIGKYLTDYPNQELASRVTIRQLLSHTGGTGDFFGPDFNEHRLELRTHEDYIRLLGSRTVRFEPGSRWEYSNYGFLILGALIDRVSGQNYFDYVRDHIYIPAGMTSTGSEPENQTVANRSIGYTKEGGSTWHANTDFLPYRGMSAGGGYTTVGDLLRFANVLQSHKLLDTHNTELLTTGHVSTPNGGHYAYGFEDGVINGLRCFGHSGGSPGVNGDLEICPATGYVLAVLANIDPPAAQRVSMFVVNHLPANPSMNQ